MSLFLGAPFKWMIKVYQPALLALCSVQNFFLSTCMDFRSIWRKEMGEKARMLCRLERMFVERSLTGNRMHSVQHQTGCTQADIPNGVQEPIKILQCWNFFRLLHLELCFSVDFGISQPSPHWGPQKYIPMITCKSATSWNVNLLAPNREAYLERNICTAACCSFSYSFPNCLLESEHELRLRSPWRCATLTGCFLFKCATR